MCFRLYKIEGMYEEQAILSEFYPFYTVFTTSKRSDNLLYSSNNHSIFFQKYFIFTSSIAYLVNAASKPTSATTSPIYLLIIFLFQCYGLNLSGLVWLITSGNKLELLSLCKKPINRLRRGITLLCASLKELRLQELRR